MSPFPERKIETLSGKLEAPTVPAGSSTPVSTWKRTSRVKDGEIGDPEISRLRAVGGLPTPLHARLPPHLGNRREFR